MTIQESKDSDGRPSNQSNDEQTIVDLGDLPVFSCVDAAPWAEPIFEAATIGERGSGEQSEVLVTATTGYATRPTLPVESLHNAQQFRSNFFVLKELLDFSATVTFDACHTGSFIEDDFSHFTMVLAKIQNLREVIEQHPSAQSAAELLNQFEAIAQWDLAFATDFNEAVQAATATLVEQKQSQAKARSETQAAFESITGVELMAEVQGLAMLPENGSEALLLDLSEKFDFRRDGKAVVATLREEFSIEDEKLSGVRANTLMNMIATFDQETYQWASAIQKKLADVRSLLVESYRNVSASFDKLIQIAEEKAVPAIKARNDFLAGRYTFPETAAAQRSIEELKDMGESGWVQSRWNGGGYVASLVKRFYQTQSYDNELTAREQRLNDSIEKEAVALNSTYDFAALGQINWKSPTYKDIVDFLDDENICAEFTSARSVDSHYRRIEADIWIQLQHCSRDKRNAFDRCSLTARKRIEDISEKNAAVIELLQDKQFLYSDELPTAVKDVAISQQLFEQITQGEVAKVPSFSALRSAYAENPTVQVYADALAIEHNSERLQVLYVAEGKCLLAFFRDGVPVSFLEDEQVFSLTKLNHEVQAIIDSFLDGGFEKLSVTVEDSASFRNGETIVVPNPVRYVEAFKEST